MTNEEKKTEETSPLAAPLPRERNRWGWLLVLLVVIVVGGAAAFLHFTSDAFVREQVLAQAHANLLGRVEVDRASLRLLRDLRVWGFRLFNPSDEAKPMISFGWLQCDLTPWSFFYGQAEPLRVTVHDLILNVVRQADDSYNVENILRPGPSESWSEEERFFVDGIFLRNTTIRWRDAVAFGDDAERTLEGVDWALYPLHPHLKRFEYSGRVRSGPLAGSELTGWLDVVDEKAPTEFSLSIFLPRIEVGPKLLALLPASWARWCERMKLSGAFHGSGGFLFDRKSRFTAWGDMRCTDVGLDMTIPPVTLREVSAHLLLDEKRLQCRSLVGRVCDGAVRGDAILQFEASDKGLPRFRGQFSGKGIKLEMMAPRLPQKYASLKGRMEFSADLEGRLGDLNTITGKAEANMMEAHLAEMPVITKIVSVLTLSIPGSTVFDQAEFEFTIRNGAFHFSRIFLSSETLDVAGKGTITFDGDCSLVATVLSSARPAGGIPILSKVARTVVGGLERTLLPPVRITGKLDDPNVEVMPWEPISRPFRSLRQLIPYLPGEKLAEKKP